MATRSLLVACLLLSIASEVLMSNPDSEIVQNSSSVDSHDVQKRSERVLAAYDDTRDDDTYTGSQKRYFITITKAFTVTKGTGGYMVKEVERRVSPLGVLTSSRTLQTPGNGGNIVPGSVLPVDDESTDGTPKNLASIDGQSNPNEPEEPLAESTNNFSIGRSGFIPSYARSNQNHEPTIATGRRLNDESSNSNQSPSRLHPGQTSGVTLDANPAVSNFNSNPGRGEAVGYPAPNRTSNRGDENYVPAYAPAYPNFTNSNRDTSTGIQRWGYRPNNYRPRVSARLNPIPAAQPPPRNYESSRNSYLFRRQNTTYNAGGYAFQDNSKNLPSDSVDTSRGQGGTPPAASSGTRIGNTNKRPSPDSNIFAGIVNDFTFKLVDKLNLESNFVVSPLSVFIALSMCYLASEGSTKAQLENVLGLNDNGVHGERLHQGIKDLVYQVLPQSSAEYQLFVANGLFLGKGYAVNPEFETDLQRLYAAELKNLDFSNPELSVPVINDWVSRATKDKITTMADQPPSPATSLMLLNAIFFKGIWKTQFPPDLTYNGRFHGSNGIDRTVPTMPLYDETFQFYRSETQRQSFLKLPYQGDQISMIIALPFTLREKPITAITDQLLCRVRDAMGDTHMDTVTVPKFKFERTMDLKEPLQLLGITDLFNPSVVDLGRLRTQKDVVVSSIVHKAVVEVNEQGTTAAAVTGIRFVPLSLKNTTDFVVNHPFAFYIVHEPSGLVLFHGKVFDIGEAESNNNNNNGREDAVPVAYNGNYNAREGAVPAVPIRNNRRREGAASFIPYSNNRREGIPTRG